MTPGVKKWILKPLLILLITFSLLVGIGMLLLITQQQRIVNIAVRELNTQLEGELTIEESSISPFKNFPYVSIALHNARFFADKSKMGRQLCEFDRLYVGFSLIDIFQKKYNVRRLSLQGGFIALIREPDGRINVTDALKIKSDTVTADPKIDTSGFEIDLQKMEIKELEVSFLDRSNGKRFITHVDNLTSSFKMHTHQLAMVLNGDMLLDLTSPTDTSFFRRKKFSLELDAAYETASKLFKIATCNIKLNDATFKVMGTTTLSDQPQVDFVVMGEKPDFNLMSAFLPGDVKKALKPFRYDGRVHFQGVVSGHVSKDRMPLIEVSFGCEDGYFHNTSANRKVDQLGFQGYYTNGSEHNLRTSELHLTNINARPERGVFKGNFIMHDFTDPHTLVQIESELELKFVGEFLGIPRLRQSTGKIRLQMNFKELDSSIELPEQSLNKLKEGIQSSLSVDGLSFDIPGYPHRIRDMKLHAEMKDGKVRLDSAFLRIGDSDFYLDGTLSDIDGFLHDSAKTISVTLNARSKKIMLNQLLDYDSVLSKRFDEEITGFNIGLAMQTSVHQLLHPSPLPKGVMEVKNLNASFKNYAHVFKNLSATATVNDTLVRLKNLTGMIDSSDLQFSGRVTNYQLWFQHVMKGKTQIAFDLKSKRFAFKDIFPKAARAYLPRGYRREELDDVWLRTKIDLRYDTVFKFAKAHISNATGVLKRHDLKLKEIKGYVKYGTNRVLITDSLTGTIGRTDFDVNMRLYNGPDRNMKKRTNSFVFKSKLLDVDEINAYNLAPSKSKKDTVKLVPDSLSHKNAFNIFMIPFSDFKVEIDVAKIKYNKLWLKNVSLRLRMQEDHYIYIDTLGMKVADGTLGMKGHLNGNDPDNIYFKSTINVNQVDLEKMLIKLDHLGQDVVINKNVKGRLSGVITSDIQVHPNLVPIMSKTKADLNVVIYNGSLVDFAPMQAMASYFKDKNLRMIRFDTLKNDFSFTNGTLEIPTMTINSSIGFMQISGKQSLDLKMEYYIRVPIKMVTKAGFNSLFAGKTEEINMDQVDEIEYLDKDKRIRFMNLKVTGKPGDFSVGLGKDKRSN